MNVVRLVFTDVAPAKEMSTGSDGFQPRLPIELT